MSGPLPNSDYFVDMGLPSGTLWANRNIDITQRDGFAQSPYQYECSFFSWGNVEGHNPSSINSFSPYNWGSINDSAPYYEDQVYGSTPGSSLTGAIPQNKNFDAAKANVGTLWRLPLIANFRELLDNCDYIDENGDVVEGSNKIVTVNGILGIYLRSRANGNMLFFACCGYGDARNWSHRESGGYYWSASYSSVRAGRNLTCSTSGVELQTFMRFHGLPVRPVCSPATLQVTHFNVSRQALNNNLQLLDIDDGIAPIERPTLQLIDSMSQNEAES